MLLRSNTLSSDVLAEFVKGNNNVQIIYGVCLERDLNASRYLVSQSSLSRTVRLVLKELISECTKNLTTAPSTRVSSS